MKLVEAGSVQAAMNRVPATVHAGLPLSEAKRIMERDRVRHLPVLENGELVGAIGERDIQVAETFHLRGFLTVGDAMRSPAYAVAPETPLSQVLSEMLERKSGSAIVVSPRGNVIGIITRCDALAMLNGLILLEEKVSEEKAAA